MKKYLAIALCACLLLGGAYAHESETVIVLSENEITVNGELISESTDENVYLARSIEIHEDVPEELAGLENRVVTICDAGVYRISGAASDAQIAVRAGEEDAVRIILDGADISCRTAPAIAVYTALETAKPGEYGVAIELADGSESKINGSHTEEISDDDIKLSGALTSLVSIGFEGEGYLNVDGDNEGIEVKFGHMTFNGGNIIVNSGDDPLNASEDGVAVITVNDGTLHLQVKPEKGGEGDGMDSNGSIVINGGAVSSYAHPDSQDSGIDSDMGCTINGGVVLGVGNMYDEIQAESGQLFMALQFAEKADDMIVVTTTEGVPVAVCDSSAGYTSFVLSSPELVEGDYYLYCGGELEMQDGEMVYTPGTRMQHGGSSFGGGMRPGGMGEMEAPEGMEIPDGMEKPDDMPEMHDGMEKPDDMPEMPEGNRPEGMQPPEMGGFKDGRRGFGGGEANGEMSDVFHLAPGSTMFAGIRSAE